MHGAGRDRERSNQPPSPSTAAPGDSLRGMHGMGESCMDESCMDPGPPVSPTQYAGPTDTVRSTRSRPMTSGFSGSHPPLYRDTASMLP